MEAGFAFSFLAVAIFSSSVTLWTYIRSFPVFKAHRHKTDSNQNIGGGDFSSRWKTERVTGVGLQMHTTFLVLITPDLLSIYLQRHQYGQSSWTHIFNSKVEDKIKMKSYWEFDCFLFVLIFPITISWLWLSVSIVLFRHEWELS